ncbi:MAG: V-type ATP synthase subunit B, partial [Candidatus Woesearchaeota archaeon]|nr:V-type ATP synthase subunit B [Candidatus Woesearchaeota archaeon]
MSSIIEYSSIKEIAGPLMIVEKVKNVAYGELVEIKIGKEKRTGQVLEARDDIAVVQVFEGTRGLATKGVTARFTGETMKVGLSKDVIGRIFNGIGKPIDKGPEIIAEKRMDVNGLAINPTAREFPEEFIQTGIS